MSTDPENTGGKAIMADAAAETKALVDQAALEESEAQLNLLEPLTAEEMHDAQEQCGEDAGPMTVLRTARENRKGRKPGSRNRRTDDAARYLSQFGPDPAVAMMKRWVQPVIATHALNRIAGVS